MMQPWHHETFNDHYYGARMMNGRQYDSDHPTRYETVPDSKRLMSRKGDILKFGSGFYERPFGDWKDWFLTSREDRKIFWQRKTSVPLYAVHQYAFIANRYRWIKYKGYKNYMDYGAIVMMATGPKPCRARKYYTTRPYQMISAFPHKKIRTGNINVRMKKPFSVRSNVWFLFDFNLSEFIEKLLQNHGDCEKSRDMFLEQIKLTWEDNA